MKNRDYSKAWPWAARVQGAASAISLGALIACAAPAPTASKAGTAPPAQRPSASAAPTPAAPAFDLEAAMKREAGALAEHTVQGPGSVWSVKVPSDGEPILTTAGDVALVVIPVGPNAEVRCQVHGETVDPAGTLFGVLKESSSRVAYQSVQPSGVRLLAGAPAAGVRALYVADLPGGKSAGGLKLAIHTSEQRSLLCLLDDLGYAETFEQVSGAFFSSFAAPADAKSRATYLEVTKARLEQVDVGFGVTRLLPGEKPGEREYHHLSTHLVPESLERMSFDDAYTVLKLNAKGQLYSGNWAEASSGELSLQISLTREPNGKYTYDGQIEGQSLHGTLAAPKGIATSLEVAALLKKKLKLGKPFDDTVAEYHPSVDPVATVDVRYSRAQGAPPRQVVVRLGERTFTAEIDENGMPEQGWFDLGGEQKLTISREHLVGRP